MHRGGRGCCNVWFSGNKILWNLLWNCFHLLYPLRLQEGFCLFVFFLEYWLWQRITVYFRIRFHLTSFFFFFFHTHLSTVTVQHDKVNSAVNVQTFLSEVFWQEQLCKWSQTVWTTSGLSATHGGLCHAGIVVPAPSTGAICCLAYRQARLPEAWQRAEQAWRGAPWPAFLLYSALCCAEVASPWALCAVYAVVPKTRLKTMR